MSDYTKMQGLGNSFVVFSGPRKIVSREVVDLCSADRTDGVLLVTPIDETNVAMQYWNADGSEVEMCGNGLRCVARYAVDEKFVKSGKFTVHTKAGDLEAIWDGEDPNNVEVQVGRVKMELEPLLINDIEFYPVDVGNPHAVTYVNDVDGAPVATLGPTIETNHHFPNKTNVEFVQIVSPQKIKVRVWERGVGETQACGTGMVAAARLSNVIKHTELPVTVQVLGGEAQVWIDDGGYCRMVGPALLDEETNTNETSR